MEKQGDKFPTLLVNMIKTAELTGDLTSVLDDMADYYTSKEETRKARVSAMTYPVIVLCIAIGVIIFILVSIVPKFVDMYEDNDAEIPAITTFVMNASDFIVNNYIFIIIGVGIIVGLFVYLYKKNKSFRKNVQLVLMHIPVFSQIIIYNEVYNFTKTFASLLNHGVFITDIPYYNASDDEDLKIDFYILLPQDKYEKYRSFENSWNANDYILSEVIGISRNTKYVE